MADSKISALDNLTAADPANDMIPIVDVSATPPASGNTKRISINNLLACSPSATLASATITGDLTVDTNVLKVNTTTNRVGINTTTPTQNLQITGSGDPLAADGCSAIKLTNTVSGRAAIVGLDDSQNFVIWNVGTEVSETIKFLTGGGSGKEQYRITHGGVFNWYDGASGTRMTLNATGLGVGAGPSYRLHVQGTASLQLVLQSNDTNANAKEGTVNVRHYTNAEEPVSAVGGFTTSTANEVYLGGGFSAGNAATLLGFYTAANNTTTIGTERVRVKGTGQVRFVPLAADPSGAEAGDVYYNSVSNRLKYYNGTAWTLI